MSFPFDDIKQEPDIKTEDNKDAHEVKSFESFSNEPDIKIEGDREFEDVKDTDFKIEDNSVLVPLTLKDCIAPIYCSVPINNSIEQSPIKTEEGTDFSDASHKQSDNSNSSNVALSDAPVDSYEKKVSIDIDCDHNYSRSKTIGEKLKEQYDVHDLRTSKHYRPTRVHRLTLSDTESDGPHGPDGPDDSAEEKAEDERDHNYARRMTIAEKILQPYLYQCSYCAKCYSMKPNLIKHMEIHK